MQLLQANCPGPLYRPCAQRKHVVLVLAACVALYRPDVQLVQALDDVSPCVLLYVPAGHGEHDCAPSELQYPAGHVEHTVLPVVLANLPATHNRHPVRPIPVVLALALPNGHGVHPYEYAATVSLYVPAGHAVHEVCAVLGLYRPTVQDPQLVADAELGMVEYLPARHDVHCARPTVAAYLPALHATQTVLLRAHSWLLAVPVPQVVHAIAADDAPVTPVEYRPAMQHEHDGPPPVENLPDAQSVHELWPVRALVDLPATQKRHAVPLRAQTWLLAVPALHVPPQAVFRLVLPVPVVELYRPIGQQVQLLHPYPAHHRPNGQVVHNPCVLTTSWNWPGVHRVPHVVAPFDVLVVPPGHVRHMVALAAHAIRMYVPEAQKEQDAAVKPTTDDHFPATQHVHADMPVVVPYLPASHEAHDVVPPAVYVPAAHVEAHVVSPATVLYLPPAHAGHPEVVFLAHAKAPWRPATHDVQTLATVAPVTLLHLPDAQHVHTVLAVVVWYLPGSQSTQDVADVHILPTAHATHGVWPVALVCPVAHAANVCHAGDCLSRGQLSKLAGLVPWS